MQMKLVNSGVSSFSGPGQEIGHTCKLQPTQSKPNSFKIQWCNASCRNDNLMQALTQDMDSCAEVLRGHRTTLESATAEDEAPGIWCLLLTLQTEKKPNIYIHVIVKN